jgi:hypothetical protein
MKKRITLPGSNRRPLPGAKVVGPVDSNQRIEITLQVRRQAGSELGGEFAAGPGWDPCAGLGSIDGAKLLAALPAQQPAPPLSARRAGA